MMVSSSPSRHRPNQSRGFSLIEIMVGLAVGLISMIIVMQMFANSEASKRATTGGNDAQLNGTLAIYALERDIRQSGYGLSSYSLLGCSLSYTPSSESAAVTLGQIAPVMINPPTSQVPAGDANTDTLLVMYGNSNGSSEGDGLLSTSTTTSYQVMTPSSFTVGDYVVAQATARPSTCALSRARVTGISASNLSVTNGVAALVINSPVFNLGQAPIIRAYAIRSGNLTACDYTVYDCSNASYVSTLNSDVWVPVASNIVSLRAQYGRDGTATNMAGVVTTYNQTTPGSSSDASGFAVYCSWNRTLAVRVALVARSQQYDKSLPTSAAPTWSGSTVATSSPTNPTAVTLTLSGDSNWQAYRYKTMEKTVPLRNLLWQGSQVNYQGGSSGC